MLSSSGSSPCPDVHIRYPIILGLLPARFSDHFPQDQFPGSFRGLPSSTLTTSWLPAAAAATV
eukprot:5236889-Amphidinium_carterae.1